MSLKSASLPRGTPGTPQPDQPGYGELTALDASENCLSVKSGGLTRPHFCRVVTLSRGQVKYSKIELSPVLLIRSKCVSSFPFALFSFLSLSSQCTENCFAFFFDKIQSVGNPFEYLDVAAKTSAPWHAWLFICLDCNAFDYRGTVCDAAWQRRRDTTRQIFFARSFLVFFSYFQYIFIIVSSF